ncbi:MAG: hypothetical protein ACOX5E_06890 [Bacilli bacterium]
MFHDPTLTAAMVDRLTHKGNRDKYQRRFLSIKRNNGVVRELGGSILNYRGGSKKY